MDKINSQSLIDRLHGKTPMFWKKVRRLMITIGAIGATLAAVPSEHIAWLPNHSVSIMITIGAVGTALASLTVEKPTT
jgi:hypothetical protein